MTRRLILILAVLALIGEYVPYHPYFLAAPHPQQPFFAQLQVATVTHTGTVTSPKQVIYTNCTCVAGTCTCPFSGGTNAGDIIAGCTSWNPAATGNTIAVNDTVTQNLTWSIDATTYAVHDNGGSEWGVQCFHSTAAKLTSAAAESVVIIPSHGSNTFLRPSIYELHDSLGGAAIFQEGSIGSGSTVYVAAATITPLSGGAFVISNVMANSGGQTTNYTKGTNFTAILLQGGSGSQS